MPLELSRATAIAVTIPAAAGEALHAAQARRAPRRRGHGAQHGRHDVEHQAHQQRTPAAERVAQRPEHQLAERQADQGGGERQLGGRRRGPQLGPGWWAAQAGSVERERAEALQRAEHDDQRDRHAEPRTAPSGWGSSAEVADGGRSSGHDGCLKVADGRTTSTLTSVVNGR